MLSPESPDAAGGHSKDVLLVITKLQKASHRVPAVGASHWLRQPRKNPEIVLNLPLRTEGGRESGQLNGKSWVETKDLSS